MIFTNSRLALLPALTDLKIANFATRFYRITPPFQSIKILLIFKIKKITVIITIVIITILLLLHKCRLYRY